MYIPFRHIFNWRYIWKCFQCKQNETVSYKLTDYRHTWMDKHDIWNPQSINPCKYRHSKEKVFLQILNLIKASTTKTSLTPFCVSRLTPCQTPGLFIEKARNFWHLWLSSDPSTDWLSVKPSVSNWLIIRVEIQQELPVSQIKAQYNHVRHVINEGPLLSFKSWLTQLVLINSHCAHG